MQYLDNIFIHVQNSGCFSMFYIHHIILMMTSFCISNESNNCGLLRLHFRGLMAFMCETQNKLSGWKAVQATESSCGLALAQL